MSQHYDVIIVGAGPNGLTTGAYLAKAGARVLLLEQRHETGGGLVTEEFSGFRFNLHATYMMMMDVMPPYQDLDLDSYGCRYVQPEVPVSLLTREGKALTLYRDVERTVQSIERFSARDAQRFREVWGQCKRLAEECLIPATYTPPVPPLDYAEMLNQSDVGRALLSISERSPRDIIEGWGFENEYLKALLLYLACMWGLDPEGTGVGYMVPLYINRMLNVALVKGSSHRLSSAIQKVAKAHGADVLEVAEVTRVLVEDGAAKGVELADGRRFEGRAVVTSTDPQTTFLKLVGEEVCRGLSPGLAETSKAWEWESWSLFGVHLALSGRPLFKAADYDPAVGQAFIKVIGLESEEEVAAHIARVMRGEFEPAGHITVVSDFDPQQAPVDVFPGVAVARWESLAPYQPLGGGWDGLGEEYAERVWHRLKEYAPNLDKLRVIRRYVYPPNYIEMKLANMVRGSIKHGAYIPTQMGYLRPNIECSSTRTPIKNLYLCGASVHPGGMVLLGGGYNAAREVAQDLGIEPWWKEPGYIVEARQKGLVG